MIMCNIIKLICKINLYLFKMMDKRWKINIDEQIKGKKRINKFIKNMWKYF